jgi:hypothetical protein
VVRLTLNRLRKIEAEATKMDAAPGWLTEEYGLSRYWDLIVMALDRFSCQDPSWQKPYAYQDGGYAPTGRLLEEYSDAAIEFAGTISEEIGRAETYIKASRVAHKMMAHLPNPHQSHMGSRVIWL